MARNRTNLPLNSINSSSEHPSSEANQPSAQDPNMPSVDAVLKTSEGVGDAIKEGVKEDIKTKEKLDHLVGLSEQVLFRASTVFPFDLFPTEIIIDLNKISLIDKITFGSTKIHSIFILDVTDVLVHIGLFFAVLEIIDAGFVENSIKIKTLRKDDARQARRIIQGIVIAKKQGIDLSTVAQIPQLVEKLEKLGQSKD